jgi:hypothetical protein
VPTVLEDLAAGDSFSSMPITIRVNAAERVRYSVLSGDIGDKELVTAFRRAFEASDFDPTLNGLVDLREVRKLDVTSNGIWQLAQILRPADQTAHGRRVALVASSDFQFGMARMVSTLLSAGGLTTEYQAFRDVTAARAWLGLAADEPQG